MVKQSIKLFNNQTIKNMKTLKWIILSFFTTIVLMSCANVEEIGEPVVTLELDGQEIDVYERYKVVNFYGGQRVVDGKIKKGIAIYLQISEDRPSLSSQHFVALILHSDAKDDGNVIDGGIYSWPKGSASSEDAWVTLEIPGGNDYLEYGTGEIEKIQKGTYVDGRVEGRLYNPYIQTFQDGVMTFKNIPFTMDILESPYEYLLN